MSLRKYIGLLLAMLCSIVAFTFSLPTVLSTFFTMLGGRLVCWAEDKHIYYPYQAVLGIKLEDMRCIRCTKRISGKNKARVADEILNLGITLDEISKEIAVEKLIEESKKNNSSQ